MVERLSKSNQTCVLDGLLMWKRQPSLRFILTPDIRDVWYLYLKIKIIYLKICICIKINVSEKIYKNTYNIV